MAQRDRYHDRDVTEDEKVALLVFNPSEEVIERWVP